MLNPSLGHFKAYIPEPDARLKVSGGYVSAPGSVAKRSFFGKAVSVVSQAFTPDDKRTMGKFKQALATGISSDSASTLEASIKQAKAELKQIDKHYTPQGYPKPEGKTLPGSPDAPTVKEMRDRLSLVANSVSLSVNTPLTGKTVEVAVKLTELIEANKHDPMFQLMGPSKFLGYALASERNIANAEPQFKAAAANMTTCEKVALFGYTCADYTTINTALRTGNTDSKLQAYIDHATSGLKKCPVYADNGGKTIRSLNDTPSTKGWPNERYKHGSQVREAWFSSSAVVAIKGGYTMHVTGQGHNVSPFSAWPKETEVLYPPGTTFSITVDRNDSNVFHAQHVVVPGT